MADFDLPSFSLGLDSDPEDSAARHPESPPDDERGGKAEQQQQRVEDSGPEEEPNDAPRLFRRLRRGVRDPAADSGRSITISSSPDNFRDGDDDIEEFSSPEKSYREGDKPSGCFQSVSGSSKIPLCGRLAGSVPSLSHSTVTKEEQPPSVSSRRSVSQKSSASPLRRFHLVDSDSDSPTTGEHADAEDGTLDASFMEVKGENGQQASGSQQKRKGESSSAIETQDLWRNFSPVKGFRISTPVLDEVCEEYYRNKSRRVDAHTSVNDDQRRNQWTNQKIENSPEEKCEHPPAYRYFFHEDPNIRNLVRCRLPHFSPIGGAYNQENKLSNGSLIDYMHQFATGESSQKAPRMAQKRNSKKSSRARSKATTSNAEGTPYPGGWMDPKSSGSIPQNAGKKRVQVTGKSAGHWYTAAGGRKVYVNASGQELTGQSAYRYYRKENGKVFKRSKKRNAKKGKRG